MKSFGLSPDQRLDIKITNLNVKFKAEVAVIGKTRSVNVYTQMRKYLGQPMQCFCLFDRIAHSGNVAETEILNKMPRTQTDRNPFGAIIETWSVRDGKKRKAYDARKRYTDADGKPAQKFKRCWTRADASAALINFANEIKTELETAKTEKEKNKSRTFRELAEYYKKEYVKPAVVVRGRKIAGFKRNTKAIEVSVDHLIEHFGCRPLRSISYEDIRKFSESYAQSKTIYERAPAVATVNEKLSLLRRILNIGIQKDWLDVSPFKRGRSLIDRAAEKKRNRMLSFEEEEKLLAACRIEKKEIPYKRVRKYDGEGREENLTATIRVDRKDLIPLIICALDTAMRRGEIFGLEWWQVDLERRVIYLTKEAAQGTKTGVEGVLPISERLYGIFDEKTKQGRKSKKVFEKFDYRKAFAGACADAGIDDLQFRDLRSTGATRMVLAGNSESQVMKITRHTQLRTFLEHYTNVDVENAQRIGASLDAFLEEEKRRLEEKRKSADVP